MSLRIRTPDSDLEPLNLDILETGAVLRVGRSTVYELIAAGEIKSVKIGRRRLVTYASCREYVDRLAAS